MNIDTILMPHRYSDEHVLYTTDFIHDPDTMFRRLWDELDWRQVTRRREYWNNARGLDYTYGERDPRTYSSQPDHPMIERARKKLKQLFGFEYDACFLNGYETFKDALGWHSDDSPDIDHDFPISVITVGGKRQIDYRPKEGGAETKKSIMLEPGSLFIMRPGMQSTHFHQIPKAGHVVTVPRISLTFRKLK